MTSRDELVANCISQLRYTQIETENLFQDMGEYLETNEKMADTTTKLEKLTEQEMLDFVEAMEEAQRDLCFIQEKIIDFLNVRE